MRRARGSGELKRRAAIALIGLVVGSLGLLPRASADDPSWTRFRGPNGQGVCLERSVPTSWTDDGYRWRVDLLGVGHSSPVVDGKRVYVTSAEAPDSEAPAGQHRRWLECRDLEDGRLLWSTEFGYEAHPKHKMNSYASSTPAIDERNAYLIWVESGRLTAAAVELGRGALQWKRDLGAYEAEHGVGVSPMIWRDHVVVPNEQDGESSIVALACETGEVVWRTPRPTEKAAYATPCVLDRGQGHVELITASWGGGLAGMDPATGRVLWQLPELFGYRVVASPALAKGRIVVSAGSGGVGREMFIVAPGAVDGSSGPEIVEEVRGTLPYVPTCLAHGDYLFALGDRGVLSCLDAAGGRKLGQQRIGGTFHASPVWANGLLYLVSNEGELVVVRADPSLEVVFRIELGEPSRSTPAIGQGYLVIRTESTLRCVSRSTGR